MWEFTKMQAISVTSVNNSKNEGNLINTEKDDFFELSPLQKDLKLIVYLQPMFMIEIHGL